jgi:hypothetical protein
MAGFPVSFFGTQVVTYTKNIFERLKKTPFDRLKKMLFDWLKKVFLSVKNFINHEIATKKHET